MAPPAHFLAYFYNITAGSDYSSTSNSISFEAGLFATTVEVPIIVDQVAEGEEVFYGTLTTSDNVLITESRADIHVNDNDSALSSSVFRVKLSIPNIFQFGCGLNRLPIP